ncbi:HYR domain-containing protein [Archangium violaceum]|uniref:HYR domain-containing protein n=1 Tax=Archangium violaceum TaxID=83451 RepID=UPI002B2F33D6|nr:HYR domain-containing protein [Archangium gephyra]
MHDTCPPARSPGAYTCLGLSLLTLAGLVSGCGGYSVEWDSDSLTESAPPVVETPRAPPGIPTSHEPPPGVPTGSRGGFVIVTGDDADDMWHCEGSRCGGLYPSLFKAALSKSRSGGKGILAIGVNGGQARDSFNSWNSPAHGGPNASVTNVLSAGEIARVDFNRYALVYLPSSERHTIGGLTDQQISALNARQPDLARFVNERGGSLIALTQAEVPGGWGFLPMPLQTHDIPFDVAEPTPALREFSPSLTAFELSHKSFHNVFTGPSGFSGLRVLAYNDEALNPYTGAPVMLGGSSVILTAEDCSDGHDNDGDGAVDGQDTDCQVCGNGTVDPGEACDDGNVKDGDGCSAACQKENRAPDVTCRDVSVCTDAGVCVANVPASVATATDLDGDAVSWDLHPLGPYAPGTHGVCVTASDGQAQDSCWSQVTVRDCEAPALVCPADFRVECSGQGGAVVSPPPATATDNCGSASVTQPVARALPLGSHTLEYSAVDASGNTATCAPTVTVVDTLSPYLVCPERIVAECTGRHSAYVVPGVATAVDACTPAQVSGPGADWYPLGSNAVRYTARDASGNESSCTSAIDVVDQTPPVLTLSPPEPLWPVDQQYRTIRLEDCIVVHDQCSGGLTQTGASASISCVSSDEPRGGSEPDVVFVDATTVKVRVDRAATGNGRVYSLHFEVRDTAGNLTRGICPVGVPLERGGAPVVDSGESWRSCRTAGEGLAWKPVPVAE